MHRQLMVASESPTDETNVQVDSKQNAGSNEGWCVVSMYLAVSCVGRSCPNSLLDVCRCVVMRCTGLSCFVRFSSTPCSRPVWGVHRTVVSDLFGA